MTRLSVGQPAHLRHSEIEAETEQAYGTRESGPHCEEYGAEEPGAEDLNAERVEGVGGCYTYEPQTQTFSYLGDDHELADRVDALLASVTA